MLKLTYKLVRNCSRKKGKRQSIHKREIENANKHTMKLTWFVFKNAGLK